MGFRDIVTKKKKYIDTSYKPVESALKVEKPFVSPTPVSDNITNIKDRLKNTFAGYFKPKGPKV